MNSEATTTRRFRMIDIGERVALLGAWAAIIVLFGIITPDTFLTSGNFSSIFGSQAVVLVVTLGLLVPLTTGDYDLSIAFTLTFSAMLLAVLNVNHGWPIALAILASLGAGVLIGLINGAIVTGFGIDSFIVTLGTGTFIGGLIFWISDSATISGVSSDLVNTVSIDKLFGIPLEFYYAIALCAILWYVFEFTPIGRRLLFVGSSREVSRLSGMRVSRLRLGAFVVSGFVSALAGVLYVGTTGAADPTSGTQFLLPAFAAAFLGATTINPGRFNPWGSAVAVYFLTTGITGLQLVGVPNFVQQLFYGAALVLAVILSNAAARLRRRQADARAAAEAGAGA